MVYLDSIWYKVFEGKEPVLVFIHGYTMNSSVWKNQLEHFREHKKVVLDLKGHGKSFGLASSVEELAKDINSIFEKENIKKAVIVGHSLGATVSLMFNKMFPDKVDKLILINPYVKRKQLSFKSRFLFWLLNFLLFYPKINFNHGKKSLFPTLQGVLSTNLRTLKFGKKEYFRDYDFELSSNSLVINSIKDNIIKSYFKEGEFIGGKHVLQVDKPEKVNNLIAEFL